MIFFIQEMTQIKRDYFTYLPSTPEQIRWGLAVVSAGRAVIPAGSAYPPTGHPEDHHFDWRQGRVLDSLQIVFISEGAGWMETQDAGKRRVHAGMVFLLPPKVWHRYRPDAKSGWTENWIEVEGPVVNDLVSSSIFSKKTTLLNGAVGQGLEEAFEKIHTLMKQRVACFSPLLSAQALHLLALCAELGQQETPPSRIFSAVREAEHFLANHYAEEVNIEQLASRLGVGYSHFRRAFLAQTGYSPWQYVLHVRLTCARRLLASGEATIEHLAERLGFSSGFHLSNSFKRAYGVSPHSWRQSLRNNDASKMESPEDVK
jgi:AraC-like DNA-binding protein